MSAIQKAIRAMNVALTDGGYLCQETKLQMSEAIQALQSLEGEAVAWMHEDGESTCTALQKQSGVGPWSGYNSMFNTKYFTIPLYTTPQPPAVPDYFNKSEIA